MGPIRPALAASYSVVIANFAFNPASLNITAGDIVVWTNSDPPAHTVTSDTGVWDSGIIQPGGSFTRTFTVAGTFSYHLISTRS